jgi:hypothetical protein
VAVQQTAGVDPYFPEHGDPRYRVNRYELADTFVEVLAVPWLVGSVPGTSLMNGWLRGLGARIGRGVWVESYWLP